MKKQQKQLLNWSLCFLAGNCLLNWVISSRYLSVIPWLDTEYLLFKGQLLVKSFLVLALIGHIGLLSLLPSLILIPCLLICPRPRWIIPLGVLLVIIGALFLLIDSAIYKLYRFHLNGVILQFIMAGSGTEVLGISSREIMITLGITAGLVSFEILFAKILWKRIQHQYAGAGFLKWILVGVGLCLHFSYCMLIYSVGYPIHHVLADMPSLFPFYANVLGAVLPIQDGKRTVELATEGYLIQPRKINTPLNYPLHPLRFQGHAQSVNIIFIVIDTWRFDMLNSAVTPTLYAFSKKALVFDNHYSGGNSTGPGIFSLFYGLPSTYWTAMEAQQKSPVFIDELSKRHYKIGVFASAGIKAPAFYKTVFNQFPNLNPDVLPGKDPYVRDQAVTHRFTQFINQSPTPFFAFLFYDAAHSYCAFKNPFQPFSPIVENCTRYNLSASTDPTGYLNVYKNAVFSVDNEIQKVLALLKEKGLMESTVILITGDHGEEFNDNHANYWGHASNFTHYQVQTPLVLYWPGKTPRHFTHQTTHFDIVPTLMNALLGCTNSPRDYSLGETLFKPAQRSYVIVGSYCTLGIVESQQIINISPTGSFRVEGLDTKVQPSAALDLKAMRQAFADLRRFYKRWGVYT